MDALIKNENKKKCRNIFLFFLILAIGGFILEIIFLNWQKSAKKTVPSNFFNVKREEKFEKIKIGFTTDAHCYSKYEKSTGTWVLNWRCIQPFEAFVNEMNYNYHPDIVIDGGDLLDGHDDRGLNSLTDPLEYFKKLQMPYYMVLGNHEVREFPKEEWLKALGYEKSYYYVDVKDLRAFVLDGNFLVKDNKELSADPDNHYGPGRISQEQLDWLGEKLKESQRKRKIIFIHQPPIDSTTIRKNNELLDNAQELRKVLAENNKNKKILAVISGHIEEFCQLEYDNIPYYVLKGFWKDNERLPEEHQFKDAGLFYEIEVENEVKITALSKKRDTVDLETFVVDKKTVICHKDSILKNE